MAISEQTSLFTNFNLNGNEMDRNTEKLDFATATKAANAANHASKHWVPESWINAFMTAYNDLGDTKMIEDIDYETHMSNFISKKVVAPDQLAAAVLAYSESVHDRSITSAVHISAMKKAIEAAINFEKDE